jgi:hypothetical protein
MSEVVQKVVKEEVEKMQRKIGQVNTGWGGAGGRRAAVVRTVRGFSLARRPGKKVEAVLDFSLVMEVNEEEEEEGEE